MTKTLFQLIRLITYRTEPIRIKINVGHLHTAVNTTTAFQIVRLLTTYVLLNWVLWQGDSSYPTMCITTVIGSYLEMSK